MSDVTVVIEEPAPVVVQVGPTIVQGGPGGGGAVDSVEGRTGAVTLSDLFAALVHSHAISSVTGLQAALDAKQPAGSYAAAVHSHAQSDVTNLTSDLALKAPLASPALTGNPTAPTPATADNDTSIATTAFVKAQGYAPLASPTFTGTVSGITKAMVGLGNVDNTSDANKPVSTAQQTALDLKAALASPAFTGNPTAPTASPGDNDTSIATTAFVTAAVAAGGGSSPDLFPRKSGQYYTTTHQLASTNTDANVFGTSGQRVFLIPFAVTHAHSIDRLAINVSVAGGAGSVLRLGVYPHSSAWGSVSRLVSGSVAADSTGDKNATISQALTPGLYWLAVGTTDTGGALIVRRGNADGGVGGGFGGGSPSFIPTEWALRYDGQTLTTDLPATLNLGSPSAAVANDVPLVWIRKA